MSETGEDREISELYRKWLGREMARPEVRAAKEALLAEYFEVRPAPVFGSALAYPALALAILFMYFNFLSPVKDLSFLRKQEAMVATRPAGDDIQAVEPLPAADRPAVEIKRLTSRTGSTMVYQKSINDVPVTIIWVFTGGSKI